MRRSQRADGARAPFDVLTVALHWSTVFLIALLAATGFAVQYLAGLALTPAVLDLHRSAGTIVLVATTARLLWRQSFARFPPFPPQMPRFQQWLGRRSEHLLYGLLLLQPLTGLAMSALLGRPFTLLAWTVPALFPRNIDLWLAVLSIHRLCAYGLFALLFGHAGAALVHHYVLRDDVLEMMAPWISKRRNRSSFDETRLTQLQEV